MHLLQQFVNSGIVVMLNRKTLRRLPDVNTSYKPACIPSSIFCVSLNTKRQRFRNNYIDIQLYIS